MNQEEFKIGEWTFKFSKMKTTKVLTLMRMLASEKPEDIEACYEMILSHVEIDLEGTFRPLMNKGIIFPTILEDRVDVLQNLNLRFIKSLVPVFKKSTELNK